uniref:Transthyretin-like family protein n=1 Tax=Parastrongyloides trichosuri TaxID=131310 RepID=A0A0N5A2R1_PARTI
MWILSILIVSTCLHLINSAGFIGRLQSVGVRGRLLCDGKPYANVQVKLLDEDDTDLDDLIDEGKSNLNGEISLQGSHREITSIDPKIVIYHNCGETFSICSRKVKIQIPDNYITVGSKPEKIYDLGALELLAEFDGEKRDCFH